MKSSAEQHAWNALATVKDHPQIQEWLRQSDAKRARAIAPRKFSWTARPVLAAAATVLVAIGALLVWSAKFAGAREYTTAVGEQRELVLQDGSKVTLNTNTTVRIDYSQQYRRIELTQGEALFVVSRDPQRPFEVMAEQTVTRALGTAFNVDLRRNRVEVSVLEGLVKVSAPQQAPANSLATDKDAESEQQVAALATGQAATYGATERRLNLRTANLQRIEAWRTQQLEFNDTPLFEAVEEFNRYSKTKVTIGTPNLRAVRVSGVFRIGNVEGFLYSLQEALGVQAHASADEVVLIRNGS